MDEHPEHFLALLAIGVGISLVSYFARKRLDARRRRALVAGALKERGRRAEVLAWLRDKEYQLRARRRRAVGPFGFSVWSAAYDGQLFETQAAIAEILLAEDRTEEALALLVGTEKHQLFDEQYGNRARLLFEARVALARWDEAERTLEQYPHLQGAPVTRDRRARVRLGRGDAPAALDELGDPRGDDPPWLQLTRARALAMAQRQPEEVERLLTAQPRDVLEPFARRHPDEPAAVIVRRLLAGTGPYR